MKIRPLPFNRNHTSSLLGLMLAAAVPLAGAGFLLLPCSSHAAEKSPALRPDADKSSAEAPRKKSRKKELSTVRFHLEVPRDEFGRSEEIQLLRSNPMRVIVEKEPFIWELHLVEAKVLPTQGGGCELELQLNSYGRTLLENYTAANRSRRIAIGVQFDKERRWLAAPVITRLISNGIIRFTPDASVEESERIVRGLNNIAEVKRKKDKF